MTVQDLEAFIDEEVADYADERILDGSWSRRDALERARTELLTVIAWERQAVTVPTQRLWTAVTPEGLRVGWLWVKLKPAETVPTSAFLCQITVGRAFRHHGYGRSMLAALEAGLAARGIADLCLNVYERNLSAKCLYVAAGYELAVQFSTMCQLRKCLTTASLSSEHADAPVVARPG